MMRELWAWLRELWLLRGTEDQAARRIAAEAVLCGHRRNCSPAHAAVIADYQAARHAWELQAEYVSHGYATELAEYREQNPPPTFRAFLLDRAAS